MVPNFKEFPHKTALKPKNSISKQNKKAFYTTVPIKKIFAKTMEPTNKDIEEMILKTSGELGIKLYKALKNQEDVNEFLIAEKLKVTINQLRNIIYKFDDLNLLSTNRKKDRKKGWYIYFLTFRHGEAKKAVIKLKKEELEFLNKRLKIEETNEFYSCPKKCMRASIENAMENQFLCPECGQLLSLEDNKKKINKIRREISKLEKELK